MDLCLDESSHNRKAVFSDYLLAKVNIAPGQYQSGYIK